MVFDDNRGCKCPHMYGVTMHASAGNLAAKSGIQNLGNLGSSPGPFPALVCEPDSGRWALSLCHIDIDATIAPSESRRDLYSFLQDLSVWLFRKSASIGAAAQLISYR